MVPLDLSPGHQNFAKPADASNAQARLKPAILDGALVGRVAGKGIHAPFFLP